MNSPVEARRSIQAAWDQISPGTRACVSEGLGTDSGGRDMAGDV